MIAAFSQLTACMKQPEKQSSVNAAGVRTGFYHGYLTISRHLERVVVSGDSKLSDFFALGSSARNFEDLLGSFREVEGRNVFQNGSPNALNTLLWQILMSNLARSIASKCANNNVNRLCAPSFEYPYPSRYCL